jgi:hypothetical protein
MRLIFLSNEVLSNCEAKEKLNNDEIQIMTTWKSMVLSSNLCVNEIALQNEIV